MPDITMTGADLVTFVYRSSRGSGVVDIALSVSPLDPDDPRRPGDVIVAPDDAPSTREAAEELADMLAAAAQFIRDSR